MLWKYKKWHQNPPRIIKVIFQFHNIFQFHKYIFFEKQENPFWYITTIFKWVTRYFLIWIFYFIMFSIS